MVFFSPPLSLVLWGPDLVANQNMLAPVSSSVYLTQSSDLSPAPRHTPASYDTFCLQCACVR